MATMQRRSGHGISRRAFCFAAVGLSILVGLAPRRSSAQEDANPRMPASGRRYLQKRQIEEQDRQRRSDEEQQQSWQDDRRRRRLREEPPSEAPPPKRPEGAGIPRSP
jgi:hypothetical protein